MTNFIPYGHQSVDDEDIQAVVKVLKGDWLTQGPMVDAFEKAVARYVGIEHAVSFSSGTAALHAAYFAAGIGPGDEIVTTPFTFVATANAALYLGAKPVFADISPETLCLDPIQAAKKVSDRTKAIVPVSYAGYPVDIKAFREKAPCSPIIEDASHAFGGERNGVKVGKEADMTVFSFHPVKHITTGEGGMVVTDNNVYADRLRLFRSHGITKDPHLLLRKDEGPWYYEMQELGYNYRLTDLQCALGLSQLGKIDQFVKKRREIAAIYDAAFSDLEGVEIPPRHPGHAYHLYPLRVNSSIRKRFFEDLRAQGIGVQVHYIPVHWQPYYRDKTFAAKESYPTTERTYLGEVSLPMFPNLSEESQEVVITKVKECLSAGR